MHPASYFIHPKRLYSSSYMSSLNSSGLSASLLNVSSINSLLQNHNLRIDTYELLDAPSDACSWFGVRRHWSAFVSAAQEDTNNYLFEGKNHLGEQSCAGPTAIGSTTVPPHIASAIEWACRAVLKVEKELTEYDTILGDGDCGHTFAAGATGILPFFTHYRYDIDVYLSTPSGYTNSRVSPIRFDTCFSC